MTMYRQSWDAVGSPGMTVGFMEQPGSELCGQKSHKHESQRHLWVMMKAVISGPFSANSAFPTVD